MPTGYTEKLCNFQYQSFDSFVRTCARAMSALVCIRDEPLSPSLPLTIKADIDYLEHEIAESRRELHQLQCITDVALHDLLNIKHERAKRKFDADLHAVKIRRDNFNDMLRKVKGWTPPTPDHDGLKLFMIEQLQSGLARDCYDPVPPKDPPELGDIPAYKEARIAELKETISKLGNDKANAIRAADQANRWIAALDGSLRAYMP